MATILRGEVLLTTDQMEKPNSEAVQEVLRWLLGHESAPYWRRAPGHLSDQSSGGMVAHPGPYPQRLSKVSDTVRQRSRAAALI